MRLIARLGELAAARQRRSAFEKIYRDNGFGGIESRSGAGSDLPATVPLRSQLIHLLERYSIGSVLDMPCGDFNWMQHLTLRCRYVGADIVPAIIDRNVKLYARDGRRFIVCDMVRGKLPRAQLIFCRDGLVHLSFGDALLAIANFKRSGAAYLLATTFLEPRPNVDTPTGLYWRPLNMRQPPFDFPEPLELIREPAPEPYDDKSMGLWRLADLSTG